MVNCKVLHRNRRQRCAARLGALVVVCTALATLPAAAHAADDPVVAGEPIAAPEPLEVDGELTLDIDDSLRPPDGVGAFAGPSGLPGYFVLGELVVHSDDPASAERLAEQYGGEVVDVVVPAEQLGGEVPTATLVRIDPSRVDPSTVLDDLIAIGGEAAHGRHVVSGDEALATLAAAARARVEGVAVDINWLADDATIRTGSTVEAPTGPGGTNAFRWPQLTDLNVPAAWDLLARAGFLRPNTVPIGVVDRGFGPTDPDRPAGIADAAVLGTACGGACPQHGQNVFSTVAAGVDNGFGGAGTAGPVARVVLIDVGPTLSAFTIQAAETRAIAGGARIVTMSITGSFPEISSSLLGGFNAFTAGVRSSGILQFAAAGNAGVDVDARTCFIGCWESDVFYPCELAGFLCVGGIVGSGRTSPSPGSNFGSGGFDPTATVELWGDICALVGPDLQITGNATHVVCGTSFATPAVAGVAGLLLAVNPDANVVEATMLSTAVPGTCAAAGNCARAIPNAAAAATALLGNVPPTLSITANSPTTTPRGSVVNFTAAASDPDGPGALTVSWFVDGVATGVTGTIFSPRFFTQSFGLHTVTAVATDGRWTVGDAQGGISVNLTNTAPSVSITAPAPGATFVNFHSTPLPCRYIGFQYVCPDEIVLTARTADANTSTGVLPDAGVSWLVDGVAIGQTGHRVVLAASSLALGTHTITVRATDDGQLMAQASVTISVVPPTPVFIG